MPLKNYLLSCFLLFFIVGMNAQKYTNLDSKEVTKEWKGVSFTSSKTFAENIAGGDSFSFLNTILENELISNVISEEEMVTIFAPSDDAFLSIEEESRDSLVNNILALSEVLKLHMVPGRLDAYSIKKAIEKNKGTAYFATLGGDKLGARLDDDKNIVIFDSENNQAMITASNFYHKSGFFHIANGVLKPSEDQ